MTRFTSLSRTRFGTFLVSFGFLLALLPSLVFADVSAHDAARRGDLEALRKLRFEGVDLFTPDAGGFIPYEMAALWANPEKKDAFQKQVEIMLWLKEFKPKKHTYGKASVKLTQAGLRMLGFDGGAVDGVIGEKTRKAIIDFQREIDVAETGTLGPHWLGAMYREVLKELQTRLTALDYNTRGKDGLMGPRTQTAILKFRQDHVADNPDYTGIDASLISAVNRVTENREKAEREAQAAKAREKSESDTRYLQAGLTTLGYQVGRIDGMMGGRTKRALQKWQKRQKLPVTSTLDDKAKDAFKKSVVKVTQQKLNALGYKTGKPDGLAGKATLKAINKFGSRFGTSKQLNSESIAAIDRAFDSMKEANTKAELAAKKKAAKQKAARIAEAKKRKAKQAAAKKKASTKKVAAKKTTSQKTTAKKTAKKPDLSKVPLAKTVPVSADKKPVKTSTAKLNVNIRNTKTSSSRDIVKPSKTTPNKVIPIKTGKSSAGARKASGRMTFRRASGRVVGCAIAGRNLPIEWCEPFYPLPKNNRCRAMFKSNGAVIEVKCN